MLLSICIPSYSRFGRLKRLLNSILNAKSNDFEIVVVDNHSPNNILNYIEINDYRLRIISRETAVPATRNVNECMRYAKGDFALLCLDKDFIVGEKLDTFLSVLQRNRENLCGGYCVIRPVDDQRDEGIKIFEHKALLKFGYLRKHPSGSFYKTDIINSFYKNLTKEELESPFGHDLLLTVCAAQSGKMLWYGNCLLVSPENPIALETFYIAANEQDMWFYPLKVIDEMKLEIQHFHTLHCNIIYRFLVIYRMFRRTARAVSVDFRYYIGDTGVCQHYRIKKRVVSQREMRCWVDLLNKTFLSFSENKKMLGVALPRMICFIANLQLRRKLR